MATNLAGFKVGLDEGQTYQVLLVLNLWVGINIPIVLVIELHWWEKDTFSASVCEHPRGLQMATVRSQMLNLAWIIRTILGSYISHGIISIPNASKHFEASCSRFWNVEYRKKMEKFYLFFCLSSVWSRGHLSSDKLLLRKKITQHRGRLENEKKNIDI